MVVACIAFSFFTRAAVDLLEKMCFPFRRDPARHIKKL